MKLLLVEDDREIQEMLGDYLRTEAYEVVCASNGRDACRLFDEGGIGLVLLDLMIPQVSGMDVMEHIRKKSVVPIIILSARDTEADKTLGLGMGADDYITKPFSVAGGAGPGQGQYPAGDPVCGAAGEEHGPYSRSAAPGWEGADSDQGGGADRADRQGI